MGIFSYLGKQALKGTGKLAMGTAELTGKAAMGVSEGIGKSLLGNAAKHPGLVGGAVLTSGLTAGVLADQDGQVDPGRAALKGAGAGLLLSAAGGAGIASGFGVAALGAGVMGVGALGTIGRSMIKAPKGPVGIGDLGEFELNKKFAVPLILGATAIKGMSKGVEAFEKSRMGTNDGMMRKATPMMPMIQQSSGGSYSNNAGATGDLVFAMHKNR